MFTENGWLQYAIEPVCVCLESMGTLLYFFRCLEPHVPFKVGDSRKELYFPFETNMPWIGSDFSALTDTLDKVEHWKSYVKSEPVTNYWDWNMETAEVMLLVFRALFSSE